MTLHRKHILAAASLVVVLAPSLQSCSSGQTASSTSTTAQSVKSNDEPEYAQVCVNPDTNERVDDAQCADAGQQPTGGTTVNHYHGSGLTPFLWYYLGTRAGGGGRAFLPPVGGKVDPTSKDFTVEKKPPAKGTVYRGLPKQGGTFSDSFSKASHYSQRNNGKVVSGGKIGANNQPPARRDANTRPRNNAPGNKQGHNNRPARPKSRSGGFGGGHRSGGGHFGG